MSRVSRLPPANEITAPIVGKLESLVKTVPGFTPIDQLHTLFTIGFMTTGVRGDIVEIGSWYGRSTVALGLAARLTDTPRVYCIDLFPELEDWHQNADGSYSFDVTIRGKRYAANREHTIWKEAWEDHYAHLYRRHSKMIDAFWETISKSHLEDLVKAHRGDSDILQEQDEGSYRLAFIDGDHSYDAVCKDITNVDRVLTRGGWICFDDAFSVYKGVDRAIADLIIDNPRYELCQQMTRKMFVARKKVD